MFWTTVVLDRSAEAASIRHMLKDPVVVRIIADTRYKDYKASDVYFQEKLRPWTGLAPVIAVQDPKGNVVYKRSKGNIPRSASELVAGIKRELAAFRCPKPKPDPPIVPKPEVPDAVIPDTAPVEPEGSSLLLHGILMAVSLAVGVGGSYVYLKRNG